MDLVSTRTAAERELNVVVSDEHTKAFVEAVSNPSEPNDHLLSAARSYIRMTNRGSTD